MRANPSNSSGEKGMAATSITGPKNHQGCRWSLTTLVKR